MKFLLPPQDFSSFVVLDARFRLNDPGAAEMLFEEAHLPGAQRVDLDKDLSGAKNGRNGRHPFPSREGLKELFGRLGIGNETPVLCYDDTDHAGAARAWMLLRWMGHEKAYVLHGGLNAWKAAGRPVESGPGAARPRADFPERKPLVKILAREELEGKRLVDARSPERYRGETEPLDKQAGHIPGAENIFYQTVLAGGKFLAPEKIAAKLSLGKPTFYCGSGVTAAVLLLAAEEAGREASLYPGSWSEWSSLPDAPVETGEFRRGVVAVIRNGKGEVLMFERADHSDSWQFPQGGIEGDESEEEALHRELFEEAGVNGARVVRAGDFTTTYDWKRGEKKGKRGQRHWWFLCEIQHMPNLSRGDGSFARYEWVRPEKAVERVVDWKRAATEKGLQALRLI